MCHASVYICAMHLSTCAMHLSTCAMHLSTCAMHLSTCQLLTVAPNFCYKSVTALCALCMPKRWLRKYSLLHSLLDAHLVQLRIHDYAVCGSSECSSWCAWTCNPLDLCMLTFACLRGICRPFSVSIVHIAVQVCCKLVASYVVSCG